MQTKIISQPLTIEDRVYTPVEMLGAGACASVYAATDQSGQDFALKIFEPGKRATPGGMRCIYNHYGTTRDISQDFFFEAKELANKYPELLKRFIARGRVGDQWILVQERAFGIRFCDFVEQNLNNRPLLENAVLALGTKVRKLHDAGIAHGDPHLANVLIHDNPHADPEISLIDYNMLHHPSFSSCQAFECFTGKYSRYKEDLENASYKIGAGFLYDLLPLHDLLGNPLNLGPLFLRAYNG